MTEQEVVVVIETRNPEKEKKECRRFKGEKRPMVYLESERYGFVLLTDLVGERLGKTRVQYEQGWKALNNADTFRGGRHREVHIGDRFGASPSSGTKIKV